MSFDLIRYLERIGVPQPVGPDLETLAAIQWAHLQSVPFENLDIRPLKRSIQLDLGSLLDKIVRRRRGGFCYELNGLLSEALRAIGYTVEIVSVQFVQADGSLSPPFDHMALLVTLPNDVERYFVDVGAGTTSPARPLRLVDGGVEFQPETTRAYRLSRQGERWQIDLREPDGAWQPNISFTGRPRQMSDFVDRCRYQVESPDSHFTQGPICSRNIPGGRISVTDRLLIETRNGVRTETELGDKESLQRALLEHFGINLDHEKESTDHVST